MLLTRLEMVVPGEYFCSVESNGKEGFGDNPETEWVVWVFAYIKRIVRIVRIVMLSHSSCPSLRRSS